jgi:uncharacterized protein YmfQ (DUF2313 family)
MSELDEWMADPANRAAEMWIALVKDVTAEPCRFQCLRDDLSDWLRDYSNRDAATVGDSR